MEKNPSGVSTLEAGAIDMNRAVVRCSEELNCYNPWKFLIFYMIVLILDMLEGYR